MSATASRLPLARQQPVQIVPGVAPVADEPFAAPRVMCLPAAGEVLVDVSPGLVHRSVAVLDV